MTNDIEEIKPKNIDQWGFEQWQQLYKKDPVLYEQYRQHLLMQMVKNAPEHQKERLKGLLFTMDGEKRRSQSIEAEQARYYALMMDSLSELNHLMSSLLDASQSKNKEKKTLAKVLAFKSKNKD